MAAETAFPHWKAWGWAYQGGFSIREGPGSPAGGIRGGVLQDGLRSRCYGLNLSLPIHMLESQYSVLQSVTVLEYRTLKQVINLK